MLNSCMLYGGSDYVNSWLGVNLLIVLSGFLIVAIIYMISKFLPGETKGKISGMTKVEVTQLLIGVLIIAVLLAFATAACNISTTLSQQLVNTPLQPFQYADYYIGNLAFNTGFKLLSFLYTISITYTIEGRIATAVSVNLLYSTPTLQIPIAGLSIKPIFAFYLDGPYYLAADFYLGLFSPLIIVAIGVLFLQYLLLPIVQYTAFTLILPLAIIIRSIAYMGTGQGLRNTANAVLALAIALYIIYPMTIALDGYIMNWIYSSQNPSYMYLQGALTTNEIPSTFLSSVSGQTPTSVSVLGVAVSSPSVQSLLSSVLDLGISHGYFNPLEVPTDAQTVLSTSAAFLFQAIVLFALDLAITIAFAQSLARALSSGTEGGVQFFS